MQFASDFLRSKLQRRMITQLEKELLKAWNMPKNYFRQSNESRSIGVIREAKWKLKHKLFWLNMKRLWL